MPRVQDAIPSLACRAWKGCANPLLLTSLRFAPESRLADSPAIGQNLQATIGELDKRMKEAAGNLEFEDAARLRDEIKRLQSVALPVGDDPLARQSEVEAVAGAFAGERK